MIKYVVEWNDTDTGEYKCCGDMSLNEAELFAKEMSCKNVRGADIISSYKSIVGKYRNGELV